MNKLKIALVHDDLMQWGGAEKVFAEISNIFPDAPIYTSIADFKNSFIKKNFKDKKIITSFLQKSPFKKILYKSLLPLYPIAFEQFDFSDFDLVISHTTRFAKCIITKPKTKHISYIHTPPRFLWNYSNQKTNLMLRPFLYYYREFDLISAKRVDEFIAGSENAAKRINDIYQVNSKVLYPFVDMDLMNPEKSFEGNYYLIISRLNKYKKVNIAVNAFKKNGKKLFIVGTGPEYANLKNNENENIKVLGNISDSLLQNLLSGCKALIITSEEDFGLTAIEAQAWGKPVICFGKGGALETVKNNETGIYFENQSAESLNKAIEEYEEKKFDPEKSIKNAERFSKEKFRERILELVN